MRSFRDCKDVRSKNSKRLDELLAQPPPEQIVVIEGFVVDAICNASAEVVPPLESVSHGLMKTSWLLWKRGERL